MCGATMAAIHFHSWLLTQLYSCRRIYFNHLQLKIGGNSIDESLYSVCECARARSDFHFSKINPTVVNMTVCTDTLAADSR